MKIFDNLSFYVLITCMLLFEIRQVVGSITQHERSKFTVTRKEDGSTHVETTPVNHIGYESSWSGNSSEEKGFREIAKDMKETISVHFTKHNILNGKSIKDLIPTECDLKKVGSSLFRNGMYLGLPMKKDTDYEADDEPSGPKGVGDSAIKERKPFAVFSTLENSLRSTNYKDIKRLKMPKYSVVDTPKSSPPTTPKTENTSSVEHFFKIRGYSNHHTQKGSDKFVSKKNYEASKFSNSEASTIEKKQSTDTNMSTFENTFIAKDEHLGLSMQNEAENSVQNSPKTIDLEDSVTKKNQSSSGVKSLFGNNSNNKKRLFGHSRKKDSEKTIQEASTTNRQEASENIPPSASGTDDQKPSESSAPEASRAERTIAILTQSIGKFREIQNNKHINQKLSRQYSDMFSSV